MSGSTSFDQACLGDSGPSPGFVKNRGAVSGPGTIGPAHYAFARAVIAETKASVTVTQNQCLGSLQMSSECPYSTLSGRTMLPTSYSRVTIDTFQNRRQNAALKPSSDDRYSHNVQSSVRRPSFDRSTGARSRPSSV